MLIVRNELGRQRLRAARIEATALTLAEADLTLTPDRRLLSSLWQKPRGWILGMWYWWTSYGTAQAPTHDISLRDCPGPYP